MTRRRKPSAEIDRYALYGEGNGAIPAEFVHLESISSRSSQYEWSIAPHAHPGIFQLLVLEAGKGELITDGASLRLLPMAVVAVPSGAVHAFRFDPSAEGWVLSLADALLHDPRLAPFVAQVALAGGKVRYGQVAAEGAAAARLAWLLNDLARGLDEGRAGALAHPLMAELALVLTLADGLVEQSPAPGPRSGADDLVARFRRLVDQHFREGWAVERYVAALVTTQPTLTRACRKVLDKPPGEVVLDRILLEAMRSLTYTAAGVSQIAASLGFADAAYFARFFKGRTGMTASAFRDSRAWLDGEGEG
ncbi:helix-turn-helix domain-containing protein [Novosphingobium sp. FSY-8]|uniref:Helix-turn-helix domain-containing protein n=1 Tax=Novosphingobium ovatum TaxID=1908523 RepID=A0ABW9XBY4_9SPHN|nr:helix-turn-helix domain-containing protein [Novosphingobium ovatum]NBC36053.1 helix-turn-helix domain-containing protein [Novosphingobium ovatum]